MKISINRNYVLFALLTSILVTGGIVCIRFYSYVFAKTVRGEIVRVERVNTAETILGRNVPDYQLFSYAVSIRDSKGEIHTATSEDRQWAIASAGQCTDAKFFPYPPWEIEKSGTYFGARLERLFDCHADIKK